MTKDTRNDQTLGMVGSSSGSLRALTVLGGRYLLQEPVGEGGMAVVWRAFDNHLKRDVALKVLHDHVLPVDRERFGREIRTLARLAHPGIVTIFDLGEEMPSIELDPGVIPAPGRTYFTMELLNGGPISDLGPLEDTPADLERFLTVAHKTALGLGHLHRLGMVHRDLTPRNILLDGNGEPRIMDFGLVYVSDATRDLTRTGYTMGTPQYMAPEQAKGGAVASASDVYAFGAVLYRTVCGHAPFEADNDQGILYQHVYERPKPLGEVNPATPEQLSDVIFAMLEKKPPDRPANPALALELAKDSLSAEHVPAQHRGGKARAGLHLDGPGLLRPLELHWQTQLSGEVAWPAALTANRDVLAVGLRSGQLALLELASGARLAELPAGDEVTAPATFDGPCVAYGAWDGMVRLVEWRTGIIQWTHKTRAEITAAPTRWGDRWLVASRDGHLHALSMTGKLEWAYRTGSPVASSPTFWGGLCFVADEDGWVHALDPNSGKLAWKVRLGSVHATLAVARHPKRHQEAILIVPTWKGEVSALHLKPSVSGFKPANEPIWTYDLEGETWSSPAVVDNTVLLGSWANRVEALSLETGDQRWDAPFKDRITASPVVSRGLVYLAAESGELKALRLNDGKVVWQLVQEGVQCTPLPINGRLIVAGLNGVLRAYR